MTHTYNNILFHKIHINENVQIPNVTLFLFVPTYYLKYNKNVNK